METVYHTKLGGGRRVAIPAEVCKKLGLAAGDALTIRLGEDGMQLLTFDHIIRDVQKAFAPYRKRGVNQVDELVRERRDEAARE